MKLTTDSALRSDCSTWCERDHPPDRVTMAEGLQRNCTPGERRGLASYTAPTTPTSTPTFFTGE